MAQSKIPVRTQIKLTKPHFYRFGLGLGIVNFARNGFALGLNKSLGKILQPINSYSRFPEYHFMESRTRQRVETLASTGRPRILDVSSPKCFGLYLARHLNAELYLTDIDGPSVHEAEVLWNAIKNRARGSAVFSVEDARALRFPDGWFDIVFSMSVVEHVAGNAGDAEALREMARVLKPGGSLLVTVPIGESYIEQEIIGFEGAARITKDRRSYFFQRIYTPETARERLLGSTSALQLREALTICRSRGIIARSYRQMGLNARALLGFLNPVLSAGINTTVNGIVAAPSSYGRLHTSRDLYGDLMLRWDKTDVV